LSGHSVSSLHGDSLSAGYRPRHFAPLWQTAWEDWREKLASALDRVSGHHGTPVFFRADDIGAGGRAFENLCRLFREYAVPLGMAVVPAWLSDVRRDQLFRSAPLDEALWDWHQHGWRHVNWQREGKKSEFSDQRPIEKQWRDIHQGRQKMENIFGSRFLEVFTPPWNRLSISTIKILQQLEFRGVSLAGPLPRGAKLAPPLKNLRVQIDLHTRKARDGEADFKALLEEFTTYFSRKEPLGIMIHHQRMTPFAFEFLEEMLQSFKASERVRLFSLREILEIGDEN
jgi:peptidoglycan/xylan/chitin deacetylase (PgdA/CDA1 family)